MSKLNNKVVLITGGHSGIGLATSQLFVQEGAKVVIVGRDSATLEAAQKDLGPNVTTIQADVSKPSDLDRVYAEVQSRYGRLDVLFLNAGVAKFRPVDQVDDAHFDEQFDINVKGVLFGVQKALPLMASGGSIIITSSVASRIGLAGASVYSATKAAVRSFARTLGAELAPRGIRINIISPGMVETPIHGKLGLPPEMAAEVGKSIVAQVPMRRMGQPAEIASAVLFLASDDSSFTTGSELTVGGGQGDI
jgi:NAD(P)-dependent dehydrogenase (short-subunit alcohol dehydrogenase family)